MGVGVLDHRLQHLRCGDDEIPFPARAADDGFLHGRHALQGDLNSQIPAGHHYAFRHLKNSLHVVIALGLLNLGDDGHIGMLLSHAGAEVLDILGVANEGERNHIDARGQARLQVRQVFARHSRRADFHTGKIDALVIADHSALHDFEMSLQAIGRNGPKFDGTVGKQTRSPGFTSFASCA